MLNNTKSDVITLTVVSHAESLKIADLDDSAYYALHRSVGRTRRDLLRRCGGGHLRQLHGTGQ